MLDAVEGSGSAADAPAELAALAALLQIEVRDVCFLSDLEAERLLDASDEALPSLVNKPKNNEDSYRFREVPRTTSS